LADGDVFYTKLPDVFLDNEPVRFWTCRRFSVFI